MQQFPPESSYGELKEDRQPCVAGSFYPASKRELRREMKSLFGLNKVKQESRVRAIVAPHAGYVYSGEVAAAAYQSINESEVFNNVFIIGSSHRASFNGASLFCTGDYLTPLGRVEVNRDIVKSLMEKSSYIGNYPQAHIDEHSIEVQLPFIQHRFGEKIRIVPLILGTTDKSVCIKIADALKPWFTPGNLFVISSDFSHYPSYDNANKIDHATARALMSGKLAEFTREISKKTAWGVPNLSTRMCGWSSAVTLLSLIGDSDRFEFKHILYRNSGDSKFGDLKRVVGYHAISVVEAEEKNDETTIKQSAETISLDRSDKHALLKVAKDSISSHLLKESTPDYKDIRKSKILKMNLGAFVTIYLDGKLRGCIGRFMPSQPLWEVVSEVAKAAAFNDSRFKPLGKDDLSSIELEISVLTPLRRIESIDEIELGRHGVYIKKNFNSGTFLPGVAKQNKSWSVEDLLGRISRDKAGIGWSGWRDSEIYIYEALTFSDK